ncbi:MAG TPA: hypothetical protein VHO43_08905 [Ignavibacteriales bacterium]|nr:hypothetical protein [Ignavibacteriales bacterium]
MINMDQEKQTKMLQLFYAALMADAVANYHHFGILPEVTEKKSREQTSSAKGQLSQLGVSTPEELFSTFSELFGCIKWTLERQDGTIKATGNSCLLCAIAKKMGTAKPCSVGCINPMTALLSGLNTSLKLEVISTLWESDKCEFHVKE